MYPWHTAGCSPRVVFASGGGRLGAVTVYLPFCSSHCRQLQKAELASLYTARLEAV